MQEENKKRNLVYYLLEDDIMIYKKLIPEIQSLNTEAFKNLFEGNKNYNYSENNVTNFQKLSKKFNNFNQVLEQFYNEDIYYPYLKELWIKNIYIGKLNDEIE